MTIILVKPAMIKYFAWCDIQVSRQMPMMIVDGRHMPAAYLHKHAQNEWVAFYWGGIKSFLLLEFIILHKIGQFDANFGQYG